MGEIDRYGEYHENPPYDGAYVNTEYQPERKAPSGRKGAYDEHGVFHEDASYDHDGEFRPPKEKEKWISFDNMYLLATVLFFCGLFLAGSQTQKRGDANLALIYGGLFLIIVAAFIGFFTKVAEYIHEGEFLKLLGFFVLLILTPIAVVLYIFLPFVIFGGPILIILAILFGLFYWWLGKKVEI